MAVLVGKKAPYFEADAVINGNEFTEKFSLAQYIGKRYVVFFFYPLDFTFICPTEILAFQQRLEDFEKRNVAVVGCSVDSKYAHLAWLNTEPEEGGIKGVTYPLVSDLSKAIAEDYDVLMGEYDYNEDGELEFVGEAKAYRGLFLIDKQGVVRHQVVNDEPFGRNIDEAIRMVDALQYYEEHGELCPANWKPGAATIKENSESVAEYLKNRP